MQSMKISFVCLTALFCALVACEQLLPQAPEPETVLAGPVGGLSQDQLNTHLRGDAEFARVFGEDEGLGPVFIAASCESCHGGDGKGHPVMSLTRFGKVTASGFELVQVIDDWPGRGLLASYCVVFRKAVARL